MAIKEFSCPECGAEVEMGVPRGGTVKSITAMERPKSTDSAHKVRQVCCLNSHEFFVSFEW